MTPCRSCSATLISVKAYNRINGLTFHGRSSCCDSCNDRVKPRKALTCTNCFGYMCRPCAAGEASETVAQAGDIVPACWWERVLNEPYSAPPSAAQEAGESSDAIGKKKRVRMRLGAVGGVKRPSSKVVKSNEEVCRKMIQKRIKKKRSLSLNDLKKVLRRQKFPVRTGSLVRKGYATDKEVKMILGTVRTRDAKQMSMTADSNCRPFLTELVNRVFADTNPSSGKFWYASITILKNASCGWHFDTNNAGPTWHTGVGNFSGGELGVQGGVSVVQLAGGADEVVFKEGGEDEVNVDCKHKWVLFNGKTMRHRSVPRSGKAARYTLQFYTHSEFQKATLRPDFAERLLAPLRRLGFPVTLLDTIDAD